MHHYPVFISLHSLRVLVVGAGMVGRRKIASLCEAEAGDILVLDPSLLPPQVEELETLPHVRAVPRGAAISDIEGRSLVFAATDDTAENSRIAGMCASMNVLCNVADAPDKGTFHVPATTSANGLTAAFSTGGKSPALARRIKEDAGVWLTSHYGPLLALMGRLRPLVLGLEQTTDKNTELFRSVAYSRLDEALERGSHAEVTVILASLLPPELHGRIEELLDGLC